jgi:hypothetical protein
MGLRQFPCDVYRNARETREFMETRERVKGDKGVQGV